MSWNKTKLKQIFIKMTLFSIKLPKKGWYAVKQNNQQTNVTILENIKLCANKWLIVNRIIPIW